MRAFTVLACLFLAACAGVSQIQRRDTANALAEHAGWQRQPLVTDRFTLIAYRPSSWNQKHDVGDGVLTVYIEGDGLSWVTRSRPSTDPTPRDPLALRMALAHPVGDAAYLARPCQYVVDAETHGCGVDYWTSARYGSAVVEATDLALSRLRTQTGAKALRLVGYSGGGTVAALVAARRDDIAGLITVAANLDHKAWTSHHRLMPLASSLNPPDLTISLADTPQHHLAGARDRIVPPAIVESFLQRFPSSRRPRLTIMEDFDHSCCWVTHWPSLYKAL